MKKTFFAILLFTVVFIAVLTSCGDNAEKPTEPGTMPTNEIDTTATEPVTEMPTESQDNEETARSVYEMIFDSSIDGDGSVYCSRTITPSNMTERYLMKSAFNIYIMQNDVALTVSDGILDGNSLRNIIQSYFGIPNATLRSFDLNGYKLTYVANTDSFIVTTMNYSAPDTPVWKELSRWTFTGDDLYLYDEYIRVTFDSKGVAKLYPSSEKTLLLAQISAKDYMHSVNESALSKYGAKYVHKYTKNPDGTYRWISTEPLFDK